MSAMPYLGIFQLCVAIRTGARAIRRGARARRCLATRRSSPPRTTTVTRQACDQPRYLEPVLDCQSTHHDVTAPLSCNRKRSSCKRSDGSRQRWVRRRRRARGPKRRLADPRLPPRPPVPAGTAPAPGLKSSPPGKPALIHSTPPSQHPFPCSQPHTPHLTLPSRTRERPTPLNNHAFTQSVVATPPRPPVAAAKATFSAAGTPARCQPPDAAFPSPYDPSCRQPVPSLSRSFHHQPTYF